MELDENAHPLTRGQLDIWLAQETGHFDPDWHIVAFAVIQGKVVPEFLEQAVRQVVAEAEPVRATIFETDGQVFQRPIDDPHVAVPFYDLRHFPDPIQEAYRLAESIRRTPMPPTGPLFRFALFRTAPDQFYWLLCFHHLVTDGFGTVLFGNRVAAVYSALLSDTPVAPTFFGSLQDLVGWEAEYEASENYSEDLAYWRENLPPESAPHYGLPHSEDGRDASSVSDSVKLDPTLVDRVHQLSNALGMRRSSVITAACALLARAWCAEGPQVVLDFFVSRRTTPESATFPGMVSGFVPLVLTVPPGSTVADFCQHVDTRIREALAHQRFPVHILERKAQAGVPRHPQRVGVNFVPSITLVPFGDAPASGMVTRFGRVNHFGLFFLNDDGQLALSTAGAGQPLSNFDVPELAGRLQQTLAAMTADPSRPLSSVDLLDGAALERLDMWANRAVFTGPSATPESIPAVFAAQAAQSQDAVALTFQGRAMTYRELDDASNRLAHLLADHGARPGVCVALLLPRSAEAIVAILAVLKTGAAYLPIDPAHPAARIEFLLADAAPAAALSTAELRSRLDGHDFLVIDVDDPAVDAQPATALPHPAADDIAYLIYTSGTTGVPKGVAITHHNVIALLTSVHDELASPQVWSQWHSYAFDVSVWEIWGALLRGGRLVVVPESVVRSPEDFHALLVAVLCTANRRHTAPGTE
jgi:non-ribosomal peptide synthetase component F